jgi:pre-rRNA-processing protein TSR2
MTYQIDVTDFIEAPEGTSLAFSDEKQQANFELGVSMIIHSWEILEIAVANQWGGPNSNAKRDWVSDVVIDLFKSNVVDIQLIEETILYAMQDEFDVNVEDDSSLPIADKIIKVYRQVALGDFSTVHAMYQQWTERQSQRAQRQNLHVHIHEDPENPDVSDDDDEDEDLELQDSSMEIDMEEPQEPQGPIIDDDGFELVQKKGRRKY